ncbi:site-specific integrase, partial [Salinimicrobium oceani]
MPQNDFSKFFDYLELEKKNSEHTITAYRADLLTFAGFISSTYEEEDLKEVNPSQVRSWVVNLVEQGLSNSSVNRKVSSIKAYYRFLLKTKQLEISPLAKHRALKTTRKLQVPFSESEINTALQNIPTEGFEELRNKLMVELFYSTGIRRSELIGIRLGDIDLSSGLLKV